MGIYLYLLFRVCMQTAGVHVLQFYGGNKMYHICRVIDPQYMRECGL